MKTHKYEVTVKDSLLWAFLFFIMGIIMAHISSERFDIEALLDWAYLGIIPIWFIMFFGKKISEPEKKANG